MDVLRREHRDRASARAYFARAIQQRGVIPDEVITDGHQASRRALQAHAPQARHVVTGLHRAAGYPTTQPLERAHVPLKARWRPLRGLHSIATGQRLAAGGTLAQAIRRGDVVWEGAGGLTRLSVQGRARRTMATCHWWAGELRLAS